MSTGPYDFVFKTDDDCYINCARLGSLRLGETDYFGLSSGLNEHSRDYHFGKTLGPPELDTSEYRGPWASGSGYGLSRAAARWITTNLTYAVAGDCVYEDKMVGDALRNTSFSTLLRKRRNAYRLGQFCEFRLDSNGNVKLRGLRLRNTISKFAALHLGSHVGPPGYEVSEQVIHRLNRLLTARLRPPLWRRIAAQAKRMIQRAIPAPGQGQGQRETDTGHRQA